MRKIKAKELTVEGFAPYGEFYNLVEPTGKNLGSFYHDHVLYHTSGRMPVAFSSLVVDKPEKYIVDSAEYHNYTGEVLLPLDDDVVIHVAAPSKEPVPELTGRGAGLSSEGLARKIAAIEKAIAINQPDPSDPIDVLAKVGGFDIAGMAGVFLAGAAHGVPVVMDGFISCVAALLAARIAPFAKDYMIASHVSKEPAAHLLLAELGKEAFLHCDMCLGEGTGAIMLFPILDQANAVYRGMATFDEAQIETYVPLT